MTVTKATGITVPNTPEDILAAVKALVPTLRARSAEIEQNRRLPDDIVEMLRGAGVFRMGFGKRFGGPELTSMQQTEVIETLSYADTSVGWCAMVGMDTGLYALEPASIQMMFPSLDMTAAGMLPPVGRADRVPGGYRVSGLWTFGSGITHADWIAAGTVTYTDGERDLTPNGRPNWRVMMVRPHEVTLIDNWHPTGLIGTGSVDYEIDDLFVPEAHTFSFGDPTREGPLSAPDTLMRKMAGVALGTARAALDHVREIARTRVNRATGDLWAQDYRVQFVIGECEMDFVTMRHSVYRSLEYRWNRLRPGVTLDDFTPDERIETVVTRLNAMRGARSIVRRLYDLLATGAIYRSSPMDRWLRDTETMCQQVMGQDKIIQTSGAYLVGGKPEFPLALGIVG
ncbi:acyl-CoA dehydrogenase family protein [Frankia gtarii]|uniref:acyl-CoA dehydrogenase family protein n=1 Tax=Frankia gtarii TaxID=2950102 RepID=UPI0021C03494|nr:acyl-CoA dehydrogenase family protein [Frankia gtarii]